MPDNSNDDLFDAWGQSFNVDPQLAKSVFQMESGSGQTNPANPMGIQPATAAAVAKKMGWDPKQVNVADMGWAVPIAMRVLADGLNATQSADGAVGYYNSGSTDPKKWNQGYISSIGKIYPSATLAPSQGTQDGSSGQPAATQPPAAQPAPAPSRPPQDGNAASGTGIVDTAASQMGQTSSSVSGFLRQNGQSLDPTRFNWCAAFVNGALNANGITGTAGAGKNVATGFLNWGTPVQGDPQAGDVLVQPRGHPAGGIGGHVGIFAGQIADGQHGEVYYLMQSGNYNGRVAYSWEPAQTVVARRAPPAATQQAAN
ncbi:MAG TPA: hypothetical protein VGH84_04320 [Steroidobacteraceae bacterium]|jgi:hypothetical protein